MKSFRESFSFLSSNFVAFGQIDVTSQIARVTKTLKVISMRLYVSQVPTYQVTCCVGVSKSFLFFRSLILALNQFLSLF